MRGTRITTMVVALVAVATLLAACGDSTDEGSGGGTPAATGSTGATGAAGGISTADVSGVGTVIVNADGFTLYYFTPDDRGEATCTGDCAANWPPEIVTEVPAAGDLPKELATVDNPSGGTQLTYDGWPLYTFAGDSGPGQANGEGVGGVWFAMTPDGAKASGSTQGKY